MLHVQYWYRDSRADPDFPNVGTIVTAVIT
jgi:hypothetical protein